MPNNIFRQKNMDRINSPESLNDYLRVTNPSVWLILIGALILIIGALVFGTIGRIDANVNAGVLVSDGVATVYVDENDIDRVSPGMCVKVDGVNYAIKSVAERPLKSTDVDEYVLHKSGIESAQWVFLLTIDGAPENGIYKGTITVEQISPIMYVFN